MSLCVTEHPPPGPETGAAFRPVWVTLLGSATRAPTRATVEPHRAV